MIFEVPGPLFGAKNGSQMGSESHLRRGRPQKTSWKPLRSLLEASWNALGRSWNALGALLDALGVILARF